MELVSSGLGCEAAQSRSVKPGVKISSGRGALTQIALRREPILVASDRAYVAGQRHAGRRCVQYCGHVAPRKGKA